MQYPTIELEKKLLGSGKKNIVGIDEAGRGPWAGPISVAGFLFQGYIDIIEKVADSKKVTKKNREFIFQEVFEKKMIYAVCLMESQQIDRFGLSKVIDMAIKNIVSQIETKINQEIDYLIIDGANLKCTVKKEAVKVDKGDMLHYSVAMASIIAKVSRDKIMERYAEIYPEYGFEKNVGYGTKLHQESIQKYGPTKIHRASFAPIKDIIENTNEQKKRDWKYWGKDI